MTEYVYPALFHPNDDGSFTITYPDLPGCISEGKSLENAMYMAQTALTQWLEYLRDKETAFPDACSLNSVETADGDFVTLIRAELKDNRAVRRTVSLPKWMDDAVCEAGLSLSRVLQEALKEKLSQSILSHGE